MVENKVLQVEADQARELELLRLVNSVSFDFTFLYDCSANTASVTRYVDGSHTEPDLICGFSEYLLSKVHPDDLPILEKELKKASMAVQTIGFEVRLKESAGRRYRWHAVKMGLSRMHEGVVYAGSSSYIDSRKNKENELTIKARQDPLTGLLNKVVTTELVCDYIKKHPDEEGALIVFDIDNFKHYNDSLGHLFGDEIIKECAACIRRVFSKDSYVGRIGGDEFLAYVRNLDDVSSIVHRMGKLRDMFADITLGQRSGIKVTCSVGISLYPDMGSDYDTLFNAADMALYSIKKNGRNSYAFYTEELYDENALKEGFNQVPDGPFESKEPDTLTSFAFHLLNESENVSSALNLLLYRIRNEYDLEAIHISELDTKNMRTTCTYENRKEGRPSVLGRRIDFSHKALKKRQDEIIRNGGFLIYDFQDPKCEDPGNGINTWRGAGSMLHISMRLFSKDRGCVDLVSSMGRKTWTPEKIEEILSVCNLITVCMYYSGRIKKAELEVSKFTDFDPLTGLMKEDFFIETATRVISSKGSTSKLAVVYCDISNFKYINEAYGYVTGDRILGEVAEYVSNKIPGVVCSGRFYSDNILCIVEFDRQMPDDELVSCVEAMNEKMSDALSNKFLINNISVRTGVYIIPNSEADTLQSISNANMARKIAKAGKGTKCVVFNQEMFEKRKRQIRYIQQLDEAIEKEEFYIVMQPKVSGTENHLVGAEALVRWKMSDGTEVYPDEFVPAFEKDGSIVKLDFYVYEKVMAYIRERLDAGKRVLPISMNVSRAHIFTNDFVEKFKALIDKYQIPTQFLELELTESIYLENLSTFNEMIEELRILGIRISMDDFGSGYSSLNALNDLKIDLLKIDKIFMKDDMLKESDKTIIRFIIDMAKNLSMKVLCEGVETTEQRKFLNEAGCDLHQGYLYSKPVVISAFDAFVDNEDLLFARVG